MILHDLKHYLINIFDKSHIMYSPHLKRGHYYERDTKILYCCFQELVDYIEIECAILHHIFDDEKISWFQEDRDPEAGLKHVEFQIYEGLNPKEWKQLLNLYIWWKDYQHREWSPNIDVEMSMRLNEDKNLQKLMELRGMMWT